MKSIKHITFLLFCVFGVYYVINYSFWNNTNYGLGYYLVYGWALILACSMSLLTAIFVKGTLKKVLSFLLVFGLVIWFSFYSLEVGRKQAELKIIKVKIAVDKYHAKHKQYPERLSELVDEGFMNNLGIPIFLYPYGRYHLILSEDSSSYSLELGRKYALFWVYVNAKNDKPLFYFDN